MFLDPEILVGQLGILPGMIIADIGSGIGYFSLPLALHVGATGAVYAVDVHENILKRLAHDAHEQGIENITTLKADAEQDGGVPLRDETVDMVVIINTLFQAGDHNVMMTEAKRILKPTGMLVIVEWSDSFEGLGPISSHVVSRENVVQLSAELGLSHVRDIGNTGSHHYGLVFQK
jgi:ubiquinone/menaquinone biosynthesis C-methylase UbiE